MPYTSIPYSTVFRYLPQVIDDEYVSMMTHIIAMERTLNHVHKHPDNPARISDTIGYRDGDKYTRSFLAYTIMRLMEPDAGWALYNGTYNDRVFGAILCVDMSNRIIDIYTGTRSIEYSIDTLICRIEDIDIRDIIPVSSIRNRDMWTGLLRKIALDHNYNIDDKLIDIMLSRYYDWTNLFNIYPHALAESLAQAIVQHATYFSFYRVLEGAPSRQCVRPQPPMPRFNIRYPGETSFSFRQ